jgi:hypothetical protein
MLKFYVALANRLYGARAVAWILAALGVAGFGATLFFPKGKADEAYMLLSIVLLLWSICLLVVIYTFIKPLPVIGHGEGFFSRLKKRLARGLRWVMAWTMTLLCLAVVYVSFRAGGIVLKSLGA